ncbi:MAG TPA: HAD family hydrolase [Steroidobacteraceae bacterium]
MRSGAPVVVFDFDLTLTAWDTAGKFFRWLLMRDVWRLGLVLLALPALGLLLFAKSTRKWPVQFAIWAATLRRTQQDLRILARRHAQLLFSAAQPVFYHEGLARLQYHLEQGHTVVIATGCLEVLARELLCRAGFGHIEIVGSTLRPFLGGMAAHRHCFGQNKVPMLTERGFAPPWAIGYSDSESDLPVLHHCQHSYLVNATASCILVVRHKVAGKVEVLAWQ